MRVIEDILPAHITLPIPARTCHFVAPGNLDKGFGALVALGNEGLAHGFFDEMFRGEFVLFLVFVAGHWDVRFRATESTRHNFAIFVLTSKFLVVLILDDSAIIAERTSDESFNGCLKLELTDETETSRIASPDANLSLRAMVFASTKREISADVNSALQPDTSMHLKKCPPFPTVVSAFLRAQSRQNR